MGGVEVGGLLYGDFIVSYDFEVDGLIKLADALDEVVGEGIVVVY